MTTSAKVAAVAATSGGLLAAAMVPGSATESGADAASNWDAVLELVAAGSGGHHQSVTAPVAAALLTSPAALSGQAVTLPIPADQGPADAPAVAASAPADFERDSAYGSLGFVGVTPAPEPAPVEAPAETTNETSNEAAGETTVREQSSASRTETREEAPAPAPAPGGSITGIASQYVGYPYSLHGSAPSSFNCSSYTQFVYAQAGISIPSNVAAQKAAATPVSNPQPGDLVFFNDYYHVGIYGGNGTVYEALGPGSGVTYGPLWTSNVWYGRIG